MKLMALRVKYFDGEIEGFICAPFGDSKYISRNDGYISAIIAETGEELSIPEMAVKNIRVKLHEVETEKSEEKGDDENVEQYES
jgi:hypothetical protein